MSEMMFDRHIAKSVEFRLKREDGEFDIFVIKPLPLKWFPDIIRVTQKMSKATVLEPDYTKMTADEKKLAELEYNREVVDKLDPDAMKLIAEICAGSMELSYPDIPKMKIELFVQQNMMELFSLIMDQSQQQQTIK